MNIEALARKAGLMRPQMIGPELERFAHLIREAVVQELVAGSGEPSEASEFMSYSKVYSADHLAGAVLRERERNARLCESFNSEPMSHASVAAAIRGQT